MTVQVIIAAFADPPKRLFLPWQKVLAMTGLEPAHYATGLEPAMIRSEV